MKRKRKRDREKKKKKRKEKEERKRMDLAPGTDGVVFIVVEWAGGVGAAMGRVDSDRGRARRRGLDHDLGIGHARGDGALQEQALL